MSIFIPPHDLARGCGGRQVHLLMDMNRLLFIEPYGIELCDESETNIAYFAAWIRRTHVPMKIADITQPRTHTFFRNLACACAHAYTLLLLDCVAFYIRNSTA